MTDIICLYACIIDLRLQLLTDRLSSRVNDLLKLSERYRIGRLFSPILSTIGFSHKRPNPNYNFFWKGKHLFHGTSESFLHISLTQHGPIVPLRTVPVCFGVWRTLSSAVTGPQSTRRTSLQSGNRRQTCVWLCRTESLELTPGLLEMRRPQSQNIQTTVKDVFVRTLLAHLTH